MKITAISDLHGYLPDLPGGDVLCICGDVIPLEYQRSNYLSQEWLNTAFNQWIENTPYKDIVMIPGNHDFYLEYLEKPRSSKESVWKVPWKVHYLVDKQVIIDGVKFWGTPWIRELRNWAFFKRNDHLKEIFMNIPDDVDVVLTHQPPHMHDMGKVLQEGVFNSGTNYGSPELDDAIRSKPDIKYWLCGHVHSGCHTEATEGRAKLVNVSLLNERYFRAYEPFSFEI